MKKLFVALIVCVLSVFVIAQSKFPNTIQAPAIRLTNGATTAGMVLILTNTPLVGDAFWGTPAAGGGGSGTPGGNPSAIQVNHGSAFFGTNHFRWDITNDTMTLVDNSGSYVGTVALNGQSLIQFADSTPLQFGVFGSTNWYIDATGSTAGNFGHWIPLTNASFDIGSAAKSVRTNFMTGFFMATDARKNKQLRSVDGVGVGVWSPPAAGGNGNSAGGNEAARGAIQFAETNTTENYMMNDSTNVFYFERASGTLYVPVISVQTQHIATLVVTNGIPAAGNSGAVQFNQGGVLAGTNDLLFNRTNKTLALYDNVNEAGVTIHQHGIYQAGTAQPFNFGLSNKTNMWSLSTAGTTLGSLTPWDSNKVSIGTPTLPLSNVLAQQVFYSMPTITVVGANSNQTVLAGTVNTVNMLLSTNATFTNHVVPPPGFSGTYLVRMKVTNSAANVGVNWGVGGTWDGVTIYTNANNTIWTTLTNTLTYLASWTYFGNNAHLRLSLEQ